MLIEGRVGLRVLISLTIEKESETKKGHDMIEFHIGLKQYQVY